MILMDKYFLYMNVGPIVGWLRQLDWTRTRLWFALTASTSWTLEIGKYLCLDPTLSVGAHFRMVTNHPHVHHIDHRLLALD